jgi:DNA-binding transcriptional regulator YhcF (GntR family)
LDGSSGVPPYLQIVQQVRQGLLLGHLCSGDQLPTVKEVASLAINPNTVVKAYRQLENEGLVTARPGRRAGAVPQILVRLVVTLHSAAGMAGITVCPQRR